ncbi:hypothetical protein B0H13DRAFT_1856595 [Mycena leptocephala]|nr:hypothetical protein B0H13DRAFT_1856595 [Mycena leptocephala]
MAVLGTAQMAVTIAQTVVEAHFVQRVVHAQVLNELESLRVLQIMRNVIFATNKWVNLISIGSIRTQPSYQLHNRSLLRWLYRCYVIWGFNKKILTVPALLTLFTLAVGIVVGIVESATGKFISISDLQITLSLAAATNLVLTAFTGKSIYSTVYIQCSKPPSAGRILWIQRAASHVGLDRTLRSRYNMAIGIILESGAIYCITAIFLVITVSLYDEETFVIGLSISQQTIVSPGQHNTYVHTGITVNPRSISAKFDPPTMLPPARQWCGHASLGRYSILRHTEEKDGECVGDDPHE